MDVPSPATTGSGTLVPASSRQDFLGDDEEAETRMTALKEVVTYKLSLLGDAGITKPKEVLEFAKNVQHKKVGGQQLTCECLFCGTHINSTGATCLVDHLSNACVLCPASVKDPCLAMRSKTDWKGRAHRSCEGGAGSGAARDESTENAAASGGNQGWVQVC